MKRKHRSPIWKISREELLFLVDSSVSYTQILNRIGMKNIGGNYKTLKERMKEEGIDLDSFLDKSYKNRTKREQISLDDTLISNSTYTRRSLKKRLINGGHLEYKCAVCENLGMWNNKPLSLQLDHINGISNDNRLENLRLLCPNCHSQTENYAGKSLLKIKEPHFCILCGTKTKGKGETGCCLSCASARRRREGRPSSEQLKEDIKNLSWRAIGKKYGVTDNSVRKWARQYGLF